MCTLELPPRKIPALGAGTHSPRTMYRTYKTRLPWSEQQWADHKHSEDSSRLKIARKSHCYVGVFSLPLLYIFGYDRFWYLDGLDQILFCKSHKNDIFFL